MRILFVHPPWPGPGYGGRSQNRWPRKRGDKSARYPLYLCYTATLLRKNGFEVEYMDSVRQQLAEEETLKQIEIVSPRAVFIETCTPTVNYDIRFAHEIKKTLSDARVILAGSHATCFPTEILKNSEVDIVVKGEQDYTTLNVIKALERNKPLDNILGIAFKDNTGNIRNNPDAPLIEDLDSLPFPDRDLVPHQWYKEGHVDRTPFTFVLTARGCPNDCSFCLWPNIYFQHRIRYRSVGNVMEELRWLVSRYGMKEIFFDDGTFNVDRERVISLCKALANERLDLIWGCSARVDCVDQEMVQWMKKSGCRIICYGPESASEETLRKTNKRITFAQMENAIRLTKENGITAHANFMIGFPWETEEDIRKTVDLSKRLDPDTAQFSLVFPHPGSKMYEEALENEWFCEGVVNNWDRFEMSRGPVLKSKVPHEILSRAISVSHMKFFLRPSYLLDRLFAVRSAGDISRLFRGAYSVIRGKILFNLKSPAK